MACRICIYGGPSRDCKVCRIPTDITIVDTAGLFDRSPKFGYRFDDPAWTETESAVRSVVEIPPLAGIVLSYLLVTAYKQYDVVDALDCNCQVFSAVIIDRWLDKANVEWFLLRYVNFDRNFDQLVQMDAVSPHTIFPAARNIAKSTIIRNDVNGPNLPIDRRWKTVVDRPFAFIRPDYFDAAFDYRLNDRPFLL